MRSSPLQKTFHWALCGKGSLWDGITHRDHCGESAPGAIILAIFLRGAEGRRAGNSRESLRTTAPISGHNLPFLQLVRVGAEPCNGVTGAKRILAQIKSLTYSRRQSPLQDVQHKYKVYTSTRCRSQFHGGHNSLQLYLYFPFSFWFLLVICSTYWREQRAPHYLDLPFYL